MTSDFIYVLFSHSGKEHFSFENLVDFFFPVCESPFQCCFSSFSALLFQNSCNEHGS